MKFFHLSNLFLLAAASVSASAFAAGPADSEALKPFTTDYCTYFFNGTRKAPDLWRDCCVEHDLFFWSGGTREARDRADLRLQECLCEKGKCGIGKLMYRGVRLGSHSPFKIKGQEWGNGWGARSGYRKLSADEIQLLIQELELTPLPVKDPDELRERWRQILSIDALRILR